MVKYGEAFHGRHGALTQDCSELNILKGIPLGSMCVNQQLPDYNFFATQMGSIKRNVLLRSI